MTGTAKTCQEKKVEKQMAIAKAKEICTILNMNRMRRDATKFQQRRKYSNVKKMKEGYEIRDVGRLRAKIEMVRAKIEMVSAMGS